MRYLLYTQNGDGLGLAWQLQKEGEQVSVYFADKRYQDGLKNMVVHDRSLGEAIKERPIIIFDMVGAGGIADRLKRAGYKVVGAGMGRLGGSPLSDKMELDRNYALELMDAMKITIPDMKKFSSIDEAAEFAKANPGPWVVKPSGNLPTDMTFVARDTQDLIAQLDKWKIDRALKGDFLLQKFVKGVEISTEVYFSNGKPVLPPNSTLETKKFLVDDLGPNTGCQTSVVWGYREKEPRMYQKTLRKMLAFMESTGYTGPLDINCIVGQNDGEAYGLEFCPRFGYSAVYAMLKCLDMPLGKFLSDLVDGTLKTISWKPGFGGSVRITAPPYPFDTTDKALKAKIYQEETAGLEVNCKMEDDHFIPLDIMKEGDKYLVAGTDGVVMEVVGYGREIDSLGKDIYPVCKKLGLANKQYRTDMVSNARERWSGLVKMGYLRGGNNGINEQKEL